MTNKNQQNDGELSDQQLEDVAGGQDVVKMEKIVVNGKHYFANEADAVSRAVNAGKLEAPEMRWADTLGNLKALDGLRKSMGLVWKK